MAAFRILDQFPQYRGAQGEILAGGELRFYETGTTTPKDVYGSQALTPNNGPIIDLDSSGRTDVDVWGDGEYRVRLYDADGVLVDEADNVEIPGGEAAALPEPVDGEFLVGNGSMFVTAPVREVADPTGSTGHLYGTDGTNTFWQSASAVLDALGLESITTSTAKLHVGDLLIQFGKNTFPVPVVSPPHGAVKAVTFPEAYDSEPVVLVCANKNQIASSGFKAVCSAEPSTTGFTAEFNTNENSLDPGSDVSIAVAFSWIAIGQKEAA